MTTLLDGPMGTQLLARGVRMPPPGWSAYALDTAPEAVASVHAAYAAAGATVHTTNTFRTTARAYGPGWANAARRAVAIARAAVPAGHRIAGSIGPLEDCYRPDLSPADPGLEHAALARVLAEGVDLLLCETFPHLGEAAAGVDAAVATGLPVWVAFTAGFRADLLTPDDVARGAADAVARGARAVLINCVPVRHTRAYVVAIAAAVQGAAEVGAYANVAPDDDPAAYARAAGTWVAAGATLLGGCCGAGPEHIAALQAEFR